MEPILEENIQTLEKLVGKLEKDGFPKLNTKSYMDFRMKARQTVQTEKENQTAN